MLAIIEYDKESAISLSEILNHFGIANIISCSEKEISLASGIILPHTNDLKLALRKLQLSNLYNFLKIIRKPILGVGNGSLLMLKNIKDKKFAGFGFFQADAAANHENYFSDNFCVIDKSLLVEYKYISNEIEIKAPDITFHCNKSVKYEMQCKGKSLPLVFEFNHYYGVLIPVVTKNLFAKELFGKFNELVVG